MIELLNVRKVFENTQRPVTAVDDVTLKIKKGEIYGIIGLSGAGKSTLIRLINLLEKPTSGEVHVDGQVLTDLKEKDLRKARRNIGMIFQHFNLMRSRTVYQNVAFALHGSGLSKEAQRTRILELLNLVGLADKTTAYPSQLSGGQKQRVAIARALATHPKVLLCDEATSALDPQTTQSILALLGDLNKKLGITIVLITHEMAVIKEICHSVAVMENGKVVESGRLVDIFCAPRHSVTRDFIDTTSNLSRIHGLIRQDNPAISLSPGDVLAKISYAGENTMDALVSTVSRRFETNVNIIFADVELIQGTPLGGIVAIFSGCGDCVTQAFGYLEEQKIRVEVMKHG